MCVYVCLSVCFFVRTITKNGLKIFELGKWNDLGIAYRLILGSKGRSSRLLLGLQKHIEGNRTAASVSYALC